MSTWLKGIILITGLWAGTASADFLAPDQAFRFQATSITQDQAELSWKIADGYYLYHDQFKVLDQQRPLKLSLPPAQEKDDPNFGRTQVHYGRVHTQIKLKPNQSLTVQWQGCAESGLCYPVQKTTITTDAEGLLPPSQATGRTLNLNSVPQASLLPKNNVVNDQAVAPLLSITEQTQNNAIRSASEVSDRSTEAVTTEVGKTSPALDPTTVSSASDATSMLQSASRTGFADSIHTQWNNDQFFFKFLSEQGLLMNLLIFLGLGVLLAFLPCSLPLIPILSSILVQQRRGYQAAVIALAFVLGMAVVYAVMGLAVAQLGYSFQRWFQSPIFIGLFSLLCVVFALSLFGAFQLSLPQAWLQRLDRWQQKQKGGTWIGATLMGMIAALIVGPCMSAPLAGALLFVAQLNQPTLGASYLFVLGLGLGLPLFIAAVFGAQHLPRPGLWMDRLKFSFGFVMLGLALYFARPLLPSLVYLLLLATLCCILAVYIATKLQAQLTKPISKGLLLLCSLGLTYMAGLHFYQAWQYTQVEHQSVKLDWQRVTTATQLEQVLAQYVGQPVVIDVYADWCVACQPIEKEVLPRRDVQMGLASVQRIKLDLTQYHHSQDELLKKWQILGPPTFIFLDSAHQEQRDLRLTGTFTAAELLRRLQR